MLYSNPFAVQEFCFLQLRYMKNHFTAAAAAAALGKYWCEFDDFEMGLLMAATFHEAGI